LQSSVIASCNASEDVPWAAELRTITAAGEILLKPDLEEIVCLKCANAIDAYPELTQVEVIDRTKTDRQFNSEFLLTRNQTSIAEDKSQKVDAFIPRVVEKHMRMERDFYVKVGYVAQDFLENKFDISLKAARVRTCSAYDLRGNLYPAVCMARADINPEWPFLPGKIRITESESLGERHLQPGDQLRDAQAIGVFLNRVKNMAQDRGIDVLADQTGKLQTQKLITDRIQRALTARADKATAVDAEMEALKAGNQFAERTQRISRRQRGTIQPEELEGDHPVAASVGNSKPGSTLPDARARARARGSGGGRGLTTATSRGNRSVSNGSPVGAPQAPTPDVQGPRSASRTPRAAVPLPKKTNTESSAGGKGAKLLGGYYKHKDFNFQKILDGEVPTRQTAPAPDLINYI
jgi:hypothetical protein